MNRQNLLQLIQALETKYVDRDNNEAHEYVNYRQILMVFRPNQVCIALHQSS